MQLIQRMRRWEPEEDEFIMNNYLSMGDDEIGKYLGRSASAVKGERLKLGLCRPNNKKQKLGKKRPRPSFQEVSDVFKNRGYELLSSPDEYVLMASKLKYICDKHREMGVQAISVSHLLEGRGCRYCGRERTAEAKKSKATLDDDRYLCNIKGFQYIKTQYENHDAYIYFVCPHHKELGIQKMTRSNMNRDNVHGCQYCYGKNLPHWYIKNEIETNYPHLTVLSEYQGMNKPLTCCCSTHNTTFTHIAKEVFYHGRGCPGCTHDIRSSIQKLTDCEVEMRALELNADITILDTSNYKNYNSKIRVRCNKCGHEWDASLSDLQNQNGHCPNCYIRESTSSGELAIMQWLNDNNIPFVPQYVIEECRNINPLPFDFGLLNSNMELIALIEYQGRQHYEPVKYFGGEEKYKIRVKCDQIKRDYCIQNNIPLLIIPYWDFKNIQTILSNFTKTI